MFLMVTGGSGSGKSAYAEQRIVQMGGSRRFYVATMMCFDEESKKRVARHKKLRAGKGFTTIEHYEDLAALRLPGPQEQPANVLLECMSNLAANEMFSGRADAPETAETAFDRIRAGIDSLLKQCNNLVVVTNEIFSDGVTYDEQTEAYRQLLGRINRYMAGRADEVVEVVCAIPVQIKG